MADTLTLPTLDSTEALRTELAGVMLHVSGLAGTLVSFDKGNDSTCLIGYLYSYTGATAQGTLITSGLFIGNTYTLNQALSANTDYMLFGDSLGANYVKDIKSSGVSFPYWDAGMKFNALKSVRLATSEFTDQIDQIQAITMEFSVNATVTPATLTLSTSQKTPDIQVLFAMSSALNLSLSLSSATASAELDNTGTINTRHIRKDYYSANDLISKEPVDSPQKYNLTNRPRRTSVWTP